MVFLYLNIKKYHSTKVIFILSLPLFGNVLELISLKWHFQYCKNIIQELVVLLLEYCVLSPKIRMYIVQCPSDKKNKIFAFLIWPFLTLGFSENRIVKIITKNHFSGQRWERRSRARGPGNSDGRRGHLRHSAEAEGHQANQLHVWWVPGTRSKLPLILLEAVLVSPP